MSCHVGLRGATEPQFCSRYEQFCSKTTSLTTRYSCKTSYATEDFTNDINSIGDELECKTEYNRYGPPEKECFCKSDNCNDPVTTSEPGINLIFYNK